MLLLIYGIPSLLVLYLILDVVAEKIARFMLRKKIAIAKKTISDSILKQYPIFN